MSQQVIHTLECDVPVDFAFNYVTDYRLIPGWIMGVKHFTPISDQTRGHGAEFDGEINLGPLSIHILLGFSEWNEHEAFAARFTKGLEGTLTMHFDSTDENSTRIHAVIDYSAGKGLVAKLVEKAVKAFIPACLRYVDKHLSRLLREGHSQTTKA